MNIEIPWKFWNSRDTRTVYDLAGIDMKKISVPDNYKAHHALGDCLKQIEGLKQAFKILEVQKEQPKRKRRRR